MKGLSAKALFCSDGNRCRTNERCPTSDCVEDSEGEREDIGRLIGERQGTDGVRMALGKHGQNSYLAVTQTMPHTYTYIHIHLTCFVAVLACDIM